jgi:transposase-like protein
MEKPPSTLLEAVQYFADPDNAKNFMIELRWPNGVACPRYGCGSARVAYLARYRRWYCHECKKQFSVKVGTIFEDSPIGFDKWLPAIWLLASNKNGISSCELARALGVTQKTGWFILHRVREAMQNGSYEQKLKGSVEADETYIGGKATSTDVNPETGKLMPTGPQANKTIVMGIVERQGKVRSFIIDNTKRETLHEKIQENVAEGSTVYTDGAVSYEKLAQYVHYSIDHDKEYVRGHIHTNRMENFWTLLKRTVKGTYICPRAWQLHRYVDAQAYRYNTRDVKDGDRFVSTIKDTDGRRLTYKQLTATVTLKQKLTKEKQRAATLARLRRKGCAG